MCSQMPVTQAEESVCNRVASCTSVSPLGQTLSKKTLTSQQLHNTQSVSIDLKILNVFGQQEMFIIAAFPLKALQPLKNILKFLLKVLIVEIREPNPQSMPRTPLNEDCYLKFWSTRILPVCPVR